MLNNLKHLSLNDRLYYTQNTIHYTVAQYTVQLQRNSTKQPDKNLMLARINTPSCLNYVNADALKYFLDRKLFVSFRNFILFLICPSL